MKQVRLVFLEKATVWCNFYFIMYSKRDKFIQKYNFCLFALFTWQCGSVQFDSLPDQFVFGKIGPLYNNSLL